MDTFLVFYYSVHILSGLGKKVNAFYFNLLPVINVEQVFAAAENWFKPPMKIFDRTKAVNRRLLDESFYRKYSCLIFVVICLCVSCRVVRAFVGAILSRYPYL